jgi:hypothetical protein
MRSGFTHVRRRQNVIFQPSKPRWGATERPAAELRIKCPTYTRNGNFGSDVNTILNDTVFTDCDMMCKPFQLQLLKSKVSVIRSRETSTDVELEESMTARRLWAVTFMCHLICVCRTDGTIANGYLSVTNSSGENSKGFLNQHDKNLAHFRPLHSSVLRLQLCVAHWFFARRIPGCFFRSSPIFVEQRSTRILRSCFKKLST